MPKRIIVIGGGPAGIEACRAAAGSGADVTLVANAPVGGRAGWHSLLPSKVWLTAADSLALIQEANRLGLTVNASSDPQQILKRLRQVKTRWNEQANAQLAALGVQIVSGAAVFAGSSTLQVQDDQGQIQETITGDAFIVATGSVPIFPPQMKPNGKQIIAPRFASGLAALPGSIAVVGAGATGTEFVYLFNQLGVVVTWIVDEQGVLPAFDREAAAFIAHSLAERGVTLISGQQAQSINSQEDGVTLTLADGRMATADMAFLAIGRKPDLAALNLAAAGLTTAHGLVPVDTVGRSAQPHIYFAGDVTGAPMIANRAMAQGWVAGKHAAGARPAALTVDTLIQAIYCEPQLAEVGRLAGDDLQTVTVSYDASLKAHLLADEGGFVKLAFERESGRISGAVAVGAHAADVLAPLSVAIGAGLTTAALGVHYGAHPTFSELAYAAARAA